MRSPIASLPLVLVVLVILAGCSVVSVDLTPPVKRLTESTLEGKGHDKILIVELAGVLAEEPIFTLESRPQVSLLARVREELEKAAEDDDVRFCAEAGVHEIRLRGKAGRASARGSR